MDRSTRWVIGILVVVGIVAMVAFAAAAGAWRTLTHPDGDRRRTWSAETVAPIATCTRGPGRD